MKALSTDPTWATRQRVHGRYLVETDSGRIAIGERDANAILADLFDGLASKRVFVLEWSGELYLEKDSTYELTRVGDFNKFEVDVVQVVKEHNSIIFLDVVLPAGAQVISDVRPAVGRLLSLLLLTSVADFTVFAYWPRDVVTGKELQRGLPGSGTSALGYASEVAHVSGAFRIFVKNDGTVSRTINLMGRQVA